jgi:hypothetical protein
VRAPGLEQALEPVGMPVRVSVLVGVPVQARQRPHRFRSA